MAENPRSGEAQRPGIQGFGSQHGHRPDVLGGGGFVADAPFAHHIAAHRAVGDLGAHVHGPALGVEQVEVFRERLPVPVDALVERGAGNVLDALHELDQFILLPGPHRREPDAAVAGDHRRGPVRCGWV